MRHAKLILACTVILGFTKAAMAAETVSESRATMPAAETLGFSDADLASNSLLLGTSGLTLAPRDGQALVNLSAETGTMSLTNSFTDQSGNTTVFRSKMGQNDQALSVAYGVGHNVFVGASAMYDFMIQNTVGTTGRVQGMTEPTLTAGYRLELPTGMKIIPSLSVQPSLGAQKSNVASTFATFNTDAKSGGSAVIPAVQVEVPVTNRVTAGVRVSYDVLGTHYSDQTTNGVVSSFHSNGGNMTDLIGYGQYDLSDKLALGGSLGFSFGSTANNYDSTGTYQSTNQSSTLAVLAASASYKITKDIKVIPQIAYARTMSDGGDLQWLDYGVNGKFSF